jgi:hypothetical protein
MWLLTLGDLLFPQGLVGGGQRGFVVRMGGHFGHVFDVFEMVVAVFFVARDPTRATRSCA